MLAMLSCVLSEPLGNSTASSYGAPDQWPSSIDSDFSELDACYPSAQTAHELYSVDSPDLQYAIRLNGSTARSSTSPSAASPLKESFTPVPRSIFPSLDFRQSRTTLERQDSQSTSLSISPEHLRHVPRSNSNLASAFAASLSRPFSFSTSTSSSPPTRPRKRLSPAGSYLGTHPVVSWSTASIFSKASTIAEDPGPTHSLSVSDVEEDTRPVRPPVFKTKLKNQDQFPDEESANVPLLDPENEWRYRAYRDAYAHMLFVWDLPIAMCELLKYNGETSPASPSSTKESSSELAIGKSASSNSATTNQGLRVLQTCSTCNSALPDPVAGDGHSTCHTCAALKTPLTCLFCTSIIHGLASPCLSCGHVLHSSCRALLLTDQATRAFFSNNHNDNDDLEAAYCVSGCGCHCSSDQATVEILDVPRDQPHQTIREDLEPVVGTQHEHADLVIADSQSQSQTAGKGEHQAWQDVVYESLARNLVAPRSLTPKTSQIWRGGGGEGDITRKRQKSVGSSLRNEDPLG